MRLFTQREKAIFVICILIIFIYAAYRFGFMRMQETEEAWQEKIFSLERQITRKMRTLSKEQAIQQRHDHYVQLLGQEGTENQQMSLILSEIESIAGKVNLKIGDMKPQRIRSQGFFNYFSVHIRIQGEMSLITRFLYALQTSPHLFNIDEVRFEKRSARATDIECTLVASRLLIQPRK